MGSAFRTWFNQIPGNDPIEQQQAGVMQAILLALMAITVLGIPISLSDPLVTLIVVVVLGLLAVAQRAQRRGAFRLGVRLAVGVMIVAVDAGPFPTIVLWSASDQVCGFPLRCFASHESQATAVQKAILVLWSYINKRLLDHWCARWRRYWEWA